MLANMFNIFITSHWLSLDPRFICCVLSFLRFLFIFFYFYFFTPFPQQAVLFMYGTWTVAATFDRSSVNSASLHCLRTHKFHFLSIFSLKMCLTALFIYLKIILLQWFQFSVFSFSKISSIQTDPIDGDPHVSSVIYLSDENGTVQHFIVKVCTYLVAVGDLVIIMMRHTIEMSTCSIQVIFLT